MYKFETDKSFIKKACSYSSAMLAEMVEILRNEYKINSQFFLVGSGARNLITVNENGKIDLDYNLNIISCQDLKNVKKIKEDVRNAFNKVLQKRGLKTVNDSTSALTTKLMKFPQHEREWSIDLCIVTKSSTGDWLRLIHQKTSNPKNDTYIWNETKNSSDYKKKIKQIKETKGGWEKIRQNYLNKKNFYLKRNDHSHKSFICLIEAINEFQKTK